MAFQEAISILPSKKRGEGVVGVLARFEIRDFENAVSPEECEMRLRRSSCKIKDGRGIFPITRENPVLMVGKREFRNSRDDLCIIISVARVLPGCRILDYNNNCLNNTLGTLTMDCEGSLAYTEFI
ncbi:hypothetical protein CDAR_599171 [Caerostris darwini]|uniref:Uncharacterized protein n=1 Tax=Caerostris darwini TaxID=1538125 RepID=A0AAV4R8H4_9ARAC|nr:hypothetical protein CDAR_599171 [Caerostris darwini]